MFLHDSYVQKTKDIFLTPETNLNLHPRNQYKTVRLCSTKTHSSESKKDQATRKYHAIKNY